jgi:hypothetical protein
MRELVHERAYLAVGRPGADHDFFALGVTPASDKDQERGSRVLDFDDSSCDRRHERRGDRVMTAYSTAVGRSATSLFTDAPMSASAASTLVAAGTAAAANATPAARW